MKKIKLHSLSALALAGILSFPLKAEDVTNKVEAIYIENAFYESTQDIQLNRVIVDFDISLDPTGKDDFKTFHASEVLIQDKAGQIISKLYYDKKIKHFQFN